MKDSGAGVERRDVKISHLVSQYVKKHAKYYTNDELSALYDSAMFRYSKMSDEMLDSELKGRYRDRIGEHTWEKRRVPIEDCTPWPEMQGIPMEYTKGNMAETAERVRRAVESNYPVEGLGKLEGLYKKTESINERNSLVSEGKLPVILIPGKRTEHFVEEGNSRTLAAALKGEKCIEAFVGEKPAAADDYPGEYKKAA